MDAWTLDLTVQDLMTDFMMISILLLVGVVLRRRVQLLQRFLIPSSLIAGFIGLFLGREALQLLPIDPERMGVWVYHLLALTFICVGFLRTDRKQPGAAIHLGLLQVAVMCMQGIIGLSIALLAAATLFPEVNPAMGMLLPLGFAMGPGIAYTIGQSWADFGFESGGSIGLTIAAIGFLIAYGFGMLLINRREDAPAWNDIPEHIRTGIRAPGTGIEGSKLTFSGASVETLAVHIALIGAVYWLTWWACVGLANLLTTAGLASQVSIVWSFHFIIANLLALAIKATLFRSNAGRWVDQGTLHRLTGSFTEFLIVASIMGISLSFTIQAVIPLLLMVGVGGYVTYLFIKWVSAKVFSAHQFERFISMFAQMTGTISSGLTLLRVTDPEFRLPVAQELVIASGLTFAFAFPLLVLINLPFTVFNGSTGGFLLTMGLMAGYLALVLVGWYTWQRRSEQK